MRKYEVRYVIRERGIDSEKHKSITVTAANKEEAKRQAQKLGDGAYSFRINTIKEVVKKTETTVVQTTPTVSTSSKVTYDKKMVVVFVVFLVLSASTLISSFIAFLDNLPIIGVVMLVLAIGFAIPTFIFFKKSKNNA